jgi:threonine aldolase
MNFASDNTAAIAPDILKAIAAVNEGFVLGYGNDPVTRDVEKRLSAFFEREVAVSLVATGTAANSLALAHVTPPWNGVLCHANAHIMTDECGAPEFFGHGMKLIGLPGDHGKLQLDTVTAALARYSGRSPHQVNAASVSITQATEAGTIYRVEEIAAIATAAHAAGVKLHMDGARFLNALVRLNASPAEVTWKAGVDVLSFGATKGGALAAEAVVFFDPKLAAMMPERRKRGGHLFSKHRFLAAQFDAFLADDYGLRLARHANAMADLLAARLADAGISLVWPVEANLVFAAMPKAIDARLRAAGAAYYVRRSDALPEDQMLVRMVTSFATREDEIENFASLIQKR